MFALSEAGVPRELSETRMLACASGVSAAPALLFSQLSRPEKAVKPKPVQGLRVHGGVSYFGKPCREVHHNRRLGVRIGSK